MKIQAYKDCDICGKVVARQRNLFFYRKLVDYITIKERTDYFGDEYSQDLHICKDCWDKVMQCLRTNVFPYEITLDEDD